MLFVLCNELQSRDQIDPHWMHVYCTPYHNQCFYIRFYTWIHSKYASINSIASNLCSLSLYIQTSYRHTHTRTRTLKFTATHLKRKDLMNKYHNFRTLTCSCCLSMYYTVWIGAMKHATIYCFLLQSKSGEIERMTECLCEREIEGVLGWGAKWKRVGKRNVHKEHAIIFIINVSRIIYFCRWC